MDPASDTTPDPYPGRRYRVEARVIGHANSAAAYYYTKDVEMFAFEESPDGLLLLLTEQSKAELRRSEAALIDPLVVGPNDPASHHLVESMAVDP